MKYRLLEFLICPNCGSEFDVTEFAASSAAGHIAEVLEGVLVCKNCRDTHPIIGGIPRILFGSFRAKLIAEHPDFFAKHEDILRAGFGMNKEAHAANMEGVAKMYEFGWRKFPEAWEEFRAEFKHMLHPILNEDSFEDKVVLDAGCGQGRFSLFSIEFGAKELICFDLSGAVELAYEKLKGEPNAHVLQADIYHLPFRKSFDLIYCVGVLHHLPDPERGFDCLAELLRPGSAIFIWVYGVSRIVGLLRVLRKMTLRIPQKQMYYLAVIPAIVLAFLNMLYLILKKIPWIGRSAEMVPLWQYSERSFGGKYWVMFDHLSVPIINFYRRQDIEGWFSEAGLSDIMISERYGEQQGSSWRGYGRK